MRRSISTHLPSSSTHQSILHLCTLRRLDDALHTLLHSGDSSAFDSLAYSTVLQLCIDLGAKREGRSIYEHLRRIGYPSDLRLDNKLVIFFVKSGDVRSAREVFDGMLRRTVVSWTAMVSGYSQNGYCEEAVKTFTLMRRCGFWPNEFTFGSTLSACSGMGCVRGGSQVHGISLKSGFGGNVFVQAALLDSYAKLGFIEDAELIFKSMKRRDAVSWNAMIGGYAAQGLGRDSLLVFHGMMRDGNLPDHFTFASALRACGRVRDPLKAYQIHVLIIKLGFVNNGIVAGSLIDAYSKCRSLECAKIIYNSLENKDLISCTALITGYSLGAGFISEAFRLFSMINQTRFAVDDIIICSMLSSCGKVAALSMGRQIHACALKNQLDSDLATNNAIIDMYAKSGEIGCARRAFDEMQSRSVISWTSLINGYAKHGLGEDAVRLFEKMESDGLEPNDVTFLSVLSACSHSGLTNKGREFFISMVNKYGIQPRDEHYSCVVDLLARGGELEEAYGFACKIGTRLNTSLWGALLGGCRMHISISYGILAAGNLFDMDPTNSSNYIVLSNIYSFSGLWNETGRIRNLMENRYLKKDCGWSSLGFIKTREPHLLETR